MIVEQLMTDHLARGKENQRNKPGFHANAVPE